MSHNPLVNLTPGLFGRKEETWEHLLDGVIGLQLIYTQYDNKSRNKQPMSKYYLHAPRPDPLDPAEEPGTIGGEVRDLLIAYDIKGGEIEFILDVADVMLSLGGTEERWEQELLQNLKTKYGMK